MEITTFENELSTVLLWAGIYVKDIHRIILECLSNDEKPIIFPFWIETPQSRFNIFSTISFTCTRPATFMDEREVTHVKADIDSMILTNTGKIRCSTSCAQTPLNISQDSRVEDPGWRGHYQIYAEVGTKKYSSCNVTNVRLDGRPVVGERMLPSAKLALKHGVKLRPFGLLPEESRNNRNKRKSAD